MSDTTSAPRVEPSAPSNSPPPSARNGRIETPVSPEPTVVVPTERPGLEPSISSGSNADRFDQLSRIEDKAARIEEKYSRSEAMMRRVIDKVDAASERMMSVATQTELAAVRGEVSFIMRRVRRLPGFGALALVAVGSSILTAIIFLLLLRYGGSLLGLR